MFGHFYELLIILGLGLIIFGPEKLPEVAANAGKMVRELREIVDNAINPEDHRVPDEDFSDYYYESLARSGEDAPTVDEDEDFTMDMDGEGIWHVVTPEHDETVSEEEAAEEHAELFRLMEADGHEDVQNGAGAHPVEVDASDPAEGEERQPPTQV